VFYNPVQEFNRDISIIAIKEYCKILEEERSIQNKTQTGINLLEALSATGLRSIRYL